MLYIWILFSPVNVALNKPAHQDTQWSYGNPKSDASNAVDGLKSNLDWSGGQCAITDNSQRTATWWVNLTSILSIQYITIYYRTGNYEWGPSNAHTGRFLGFSVYVSNSTDRLQGTLCYKDDNFTRDTIPAVFNTTCPVHGQFVIYYNERLSGKTNTAGYSEYAFNDLCEVEVYGECPIPGFYGSNCSVPCPGVNCQSCHIETGTCQRCKPGFKGNHCELACSGGMFGDKCKEMCGKCGVSEQCHHINGTCLNGCESGYQGDKCSEECTVGMYGDRCQNRCGHCLNVSQCHHVNGTCLSGCQPGYKAGLCNQPCSGGMYGDKCRESCGKCGVSEQCHHINGTCLNGCERGYQGDKCTEACSDGMYGDKCKESCGKCRGSEQCHHINGTCLNGCESGYQGNKCTEVCSDGFYGLDCADKCNNTCKGCNIVDGLCDKGCIAGCLGHHFVCNYGYYGIGCRQECSTFCRKSRDCHPVSGYCKDGCKNGWQGMDCLEVQKIMATDKNWKSEFSGILSAFCILLILNGVVIAYCLINRFRNQPVKLPAMRMSSSSHNVKQVDVSNVYINDIKSSDYQELNEFNKVQTYDTLEHTY